MRNRFWVRFLITLVCLSMLHAVAWADELQSPKSIVQTEAVLLTGNVVASVQKIPVFQASPWALETVTEADAQGILPAALAQLDLAKAITRAEYAGVVVRIYEVCTGSYLTAAVNNPFGDTVDSDVLKAYAAGLVAGVASDAFAPNDLLSREQAAVLLTRLWLRLAENSSTGIIPEFTQPPLFRDDEAISDWAKESVYFMVSKQLIGGMGENIFAPRNRTESEVERGYANTTREQAVILGLRLYNAIRAEVLGAETPVVTIENPPIDDPTVTTDNPPIGDPTVTTDDPTTDDQPEDDVLYPLVLFVTDENVQNIIYQQAYTDGTPQDIVAKLVEAGVLNEGCALVSAEFNHHGGIVVTMNEAYGHDVSQWGSAGLLRYIDCLVNTLLYYYQEDHIWLKVGDAPLESGYDVYDYPFTFFGMPPHELYPKTLGSRAVYVIDSQATHLQLNIDYGFLDPKFVVQRMVDLGVYPQGTAVNKHEVDEHNNLIIDMNAQFGAYLRNLGSGSEHLAMYALVNSLITTSGWFDQIRITVEGEIFETGHVIYDQPMVFNDSVTSQRRLKTDEHDQLWLNHWGYYTDGNFRFLVIRFNLTDPTITWGLEASEYGVHGSAYPVYKLSDDVYVVNALQSITYIEGAEAIRPQHFITLDFSDFEANQSIEAKIDLDGNTWRTYNYVSREREEP